jgi:transcriptional regulator with XRE-family HTH domain
MNAIHQARRVAQPDIRSALRRRRRALGLTQEQAGRLLGMCRLTYHRIETGARRVSFDELGGICGRSGATSGTW